MKVDFNVELLSYEGKPIKKTKTVTTETGRQVEELEENLLIANAVINALSGTYASDQGMDPAEKLKRFALSLEIAKGQPVELTIDDAALIKKLALMGSTVLAYGRIDALLESAAATEKETET